MSTDLTREVSARVFVTDDAFDNDPNVAIPACDRIRVEWGEGLAFTRGHTMVTNV